MDGDNDQQNQCLFKTLRRKKLLCCYYDTLIEKFDDDELLAVLAHEVGHYKRRHIPIQMVTGVLQLGLVFGFCFNLWPLDMATSLLLCLICLRSTYLWHCIFGFMYSPSALSGYGRYLSSSPYLGKFEHEA